MTARLVSLLIWAAVLATAVAWGLPLFTSVTPVPPGAGVARVAPPPGTGLARLLGTAPLQPVAEAAPVVVDSRFRLIGVVAPRGGAASGLALISVDGKPARAVGVGRELEPGLRLLSVGHREVALGAGPGQPAVTLALPPLAEAQRGRPEDLAAQAPGGPRPPGLPGQVPGQMGGPLLGQSPRPVPGQFPGQMPGQMPGQVMVQVPLQIPTPADLPGQPIQPQEVPQPEATNEGPAQPLR